jgi:hypothetical protein
MKSIPLYDATAAIACTIGHDEIPGRIALLDRLRGNLSRLDETEHGLLLHFPDRGDVEADLRRFALDEKRCCEFWGFAVDDSEGDLTLRWDAPPGARDLLADIARYLEGTGPASSISGLL